MATSIELSPGIVVDIETGQAYVMAPEGGVSAIGLEDGAEVWHSDAAEKPLMVSENLLIGQSGFDQETDGLTIRMLEVDKAGSVASESVVQLPLSVDPIIEPSAHRGFNLSAIAEHGDAVLRWEFRERPLRGRDMGPDEVLPEEMPPAEDLLPGQDVNPAPESFEMDVAPPSPSDEEETVVRGQVRLTLADGSVQPMVEPSSGLELPSVPQFVAPRQDAAASEHSDDDTIFDPLVFQSADGAHRLESAPIEDGDPIWTTYRWRVYKNDGTEPLGSIDLHVSFAPFVVADGHVIVELQSHARLEGDTVKEEPMQLRAYSLESGDQLWATPVRDLYALPAPPH